MNKWIAEFDLEYGDTMPEHMDLEWKGAKLDFHCRPMWIPCSEALPTEDGMYLVTYHEWGPVGFDYDHYVTHTMRFHRGAWRLPVSMPEWIEKVMKKEVIAWMPLPAPYGRKEE